MLLSLGMNEVWTDGLFVGKKDRGEGEIRQANVPDECERSPSRRKVRQTVR